MSTPVRHALAIAALLCAPTVAVQHADLIVGKSGGREISVAVPLANARVFEGALLAVAGSVQTPIGVEIIETIPALEKTGQHRLMLTGQPADAAFAALLAPPDGVGIDDAKQRYQLNWPDHASIMHVTPFDGRKTFLDTEATLFEAKDMIFSHALGGVHRLFDHRFPETGGLSGSVDFGGGGSSPAEGQQVWSRRFSVSLKNMSVRGLLDAIVLAHGDMSWVVRYKSAEGKYAGCEIAFASFGGTMRTARAR